MAHDVADPRHSAIELADTPDFTLGQVRVSPAMRTVTRGGDRREVQPRVMQVLVALTEARPHVVSRDRLIARCWNGRVVGDDAINRCIVVLRMLARDLGEAFEIQNVARVGYRVVVPGDARSAPNRRGARNRVVMIVAAGAIALAGLWTARSALAPAMPATVDPQERAEAERLYLSGSAMLRTGNPQVSGDARVLMQQVLAIDPDHAPAWVGLARAKWSEASMRGPERVIAVLPTSRAHLRRALSLSPNLASAHGLLGEMAGFTSPEAQRHLNRAGALDPNSAEAQLWLASARRASGDFAGEIEGYRRAHVLDRNWYRPLRDLAIATAEMGERATAMQIVHRVPAPFPGCAGMPSRINWIYGDMAESARCAAATAKEESIWAGPARVALASARLTLGFSRDGRQAAPIHLIDTRPPQGRIWMASPPSPAVWRQRNRSADAALVYRMHNLVAAKLMLNDRRYAELVATFDSPIGLLGLRHGAQVQAADLPAVPLAALALRHSGRSRESDELLVRAMGVADSARRLGPTPFSFDAEVAAIFAVRGQHDRAVGQLRRALSRGWVNNSWSDLLHLREEPAFAGMRHDAAFRSILLELDALYARERQQAISFGLSYRGAVVPDDLALHPAFTQPR